ncbi:MAG: 50S ribosomal protein L6 [Pseudomonadota bacterium]
MSRIGKEPVAIPEGVEVTIGDSSLEVKGKLGTLTVPRLAQLDINQADAVVAVTPRSNAKSVRQAWGTQRALLANAVTGVSTGFVRKLEVNGVGYRVQIQGTNLRLQLGFSHDVNMAVPDDLTVKVEGDRGNIIAIHGISKQRVGQLASNIRALRPPEPYKGKGVKYQDEQIIRKEGKKK